MSEKSDTLIFYVNGRKIEDENLDPDYTLLRYLREKLELPGTKLGCGEGGCGACTVMVSRYDHINDVIEHYSVNACLAPVASMHGFAVTTVEGIGSSKTKLHPVQERLAKAHGSQCGFCTPGFVMSMYTILRNNPQPSMQEIEEGLVGNLCRCTGYRPILEGFRTFTNGCGRKDCCQQQNGFASEYCNGVLNGEGKSDKKMTSTSVLFEPEAFPPYDASQEIIFPPELLTRYRYLNFKSVVFKGPRTTYFRPTSMTELLQLKNAYPFSKIVVGNTEVGVEVKLKNQEYPVIINPMNVPELLQIIITNSEVEVGAAVPLTRLESKFAELIKNLPEYQSQVLTAIVEMLQWFAGRQIRNVAALGGNIMTGSPISDLNPIFMASGAKLKFQSVDKERVIKMDDKFYPSYRRNISLPEEVLISVSIPLLKQVEYTQRNKSASWPFKLLNILKNVFAKFRANEGRVTTVITTDEYFKAYKQARRRDDDIAIVNAAMKVKMKPCDLVVESLIMAFGGMAPTTIMAPQTMKLSQGSKWDKHLMEDVVSSLLSELKLEPSAPGGMVKYREALSASFFFKFYHNVHQEFRKSHPLQLPHPMGDEELLSFLPHQHLPPASTQFFQNVPEGQDPIDPVGRPIPHASCMQQTTGEALYVDDVPKFKKELYASLVTSTRCHAKIISIDPSAALSMEGVIAFFSAKDLTELQNKTGPVILDEEVFASSEVNCVGQVIGVVVAKDQFTAQMAGKKVNIQYEDLPNSIISIQDAIRANSFFGKPIKIESGNIVEGFKSSHHILEGESYIGGQEHFYLETNAHIAIPYENDEMELISSTQNPTETQHLVAKALGVPSNRVKCRVKRMGGGFGGKETRSCLLAIPIAVAAQRLQQPVRYMLDRDEDMLITGTRHPFWAKWKVGFNNDGKVVAVETDLYSNSGWSLDLSGAVMQRALYSSDCVYRFENYKVTGRCCKTNIPSSTAFRGFGGPQGFFITEDLMTKVAEYLKMDYNLLRHRNFYAPNGCFTPFGQELTDCKVQSCWDEVLANSDYCLRKKDIASFNRLHKYKKRGVFAIPTKFNISFGIAFMNQSGALVHIYLDGSVLVTHGGTEMGQGLHTKMLQVASRALQVPIENIYISETSTDKVPNTSPTAASCGSDLNGMAILDACEKLNERLKPFKKRLPEGQWKDWIKAAYINRVSLSATGFYSTPGISQYNFETQTGNPFNYCCYGAAVSEVEIDCLTGDHSVLRADIVMDVGNSLNPAIDIGQIEGAFVQGMGLFTIEELLYSPKGVLLTRGPGAYKIPSVQDIPREFNVSFLRNSENPRAVYSSKAVGEPPLFLSASVFFAIRDAIAQTKELGPENIFHLQAPATAERIRMACEDHITKKLEYSEKDDTLTPWSIRI